MDKFSYLLCHVSLVLYVILFVFENDCWNSLSVCRGRLFEKMHIAQVFNCEANIEL